MSAPRSSSALRAEVLPEQAERNNHGIEQISPEGVDALAHD
jgi:hypothetical protein